MTSTQIPVDTSLETKPHSHPPQWKWYHYFTFNTDHKVIGIQ